MSYRLDRACHLVAICALALLFTTAPPEAEGQAPAGTYEGTESTASILAKIDVSCILIHWKIIGAMVCTRGVDINFCLINQNPNPVGILEAVRRGGSTHLVETAAYLKPLMELPLYGRSSSHTADQGSGTGLQFAEGRAISYVPDLAVGDYLIAKPYGTNVPTPSYISEVDGFGWRTPAVDFLIRPDRLARKRLACSAVPRPFDCAGVWAPWYPRTGFTVHPSEVIASYATALRAAKVASDPLGRIGGGYRFDPRTGHFIQMIRPQLRACVAIGSPFVRLIEAGALSREGAYLFVHFAVFFECEGCLPPLLQGPLPPI